MKNSSIDILCMSPCLIREDHRILSVSDVDGSKLKPFLLKEFIQIPKNGVEVFRQLCSECDQ